MDDPKKLIKALTKENKKLHDKIANLTAKNISLTNEIKSIKNEFMQYQHDNPPEEELTPEQKKEYKILAKLRSEYELKQLRKSVKN